MSTTAGRSEFIRVWSEIKENKKKAAIKFKKSSSASLQWKFATIIVEIWDDLKSITENLHVPNVELFICLFVSLSVCLTYCSKVYWLQHNIFIYLYINKILPEKSVAETDFINHFAITLRQKKPDNKICINDARRKKNHKCVKTNIIQIIE